MKILYFIFLIMSAVFYPLFKDDLSFILLLTLLIFPVIMVIQLFVAYAKLKLKVFDCSDRVVHGEKLYVRVSVKNPMPIPVSSCAVTMLYKTDCDSSFKKYTVNIPIKARSTENIVINITPPHCGVVECMIKKAVIYDLIGLFSKGKRLNWYKKIAVFPKEADCSVYMEGAMECDTESTNFSADKIGDDPAEVFGLRDYRSGDRMNRIHWKLSSRNESFVVKELSEPVSGRVLIIPDIKACKDREQIDDVLDIYASLARFLINEGCGCKALCSGDDINLAEVTNDEELDALITNQVTNQLAVFDGLTLTELFSAECSDTQIACGRYSHIKYSHIIIITPAEKKAAFTELEQCCISNRITVLATGEQNQVEEDKNSDVIVFYINKNGVIEIPESLSI